MIRNLCLILCDRILSKGTPTLTIDADQFTGIERKAAEFNADQSILSRQDCIFCPGIGMELTVRLIVAVCKTDAARVEKEKIAKPPDLLGMGMPAC